MNHSIFPFEMKVGDVARVVEPKEYAEKGMVIRRDSETRWSRVDDPDPSWVWTGEGPGTSIMVTYEQPNEVVAQEPQIT